MSESDSSVSDPITKLAKELAGKLPVEAAYKEILSPGAEQTGQIVSDIIKAIHLALAPFQFLGAYQDRLRNFIDNSVRRVPEGKRVPPASQILGPIIEGIRYEPEGTPIDAMFSELLSRSMDHDRVHEAHPSYPFIIKQLSADEARILASLHGNVFDYVYTQEYDASKNWFGEINIEIDKLPRDRLLYPNNVKFYFEHLTQLGLANIFLVVNGEPLFGGEPQQQIGIRHRCHYKLTDFGRRFVTACNGNNHAPKEHHQT
jgi:hypothetical protein